MDDGRNMNEGEFVRLLAELPRRGEVRSWGCLSDTELAAYVDGGLKGRAKQRAEEHLADCGPCLEQIRFLVRADEGEALETVPHHLMEQALALGRRKTFVRWPLRWGTVAAATAAAAVVLVLRTPSPEAPTVPPLPVVVPTNEAPAGVPPPGPARVPAPAPAQPELPKVRSRSAGPIELEQISPPPDSVVPRGSLEFRWRPVPRSLFYEVRLATAEGDLIWEGKATDTSLRPPDDLPLQGARKYFVWVRAYLPEGKTVRSRALAFSVKDGS